jgi:hypothetical protein
VSPVLNSVVHGSEEFRFEAALHAIGVYRRAKLIRRLAVVLTVAIMAARLVLLALCIPVGEKDATIPVLAGISLVASIFTISLEWSTRAQCKDLLDEFDSCARREAASS